MAKVLLVEDDNNLREIYEARLAAEGYDITSAQDGEEALVVAKQAKPDLVISDVMMPKISGFEMLDILRNTAGLEHVKVIMLTALGQSEDRDRADSLGADKYLVKSQVTLEDIVKTAHELLDDQGTLPPAAAASTPSEPTTATIPMATAPEPEAVAPAPPAAADPLDQALADITTPAATTPMAPPADEPVDEVDDAATTPTEHAPAAEVVPTSSEPVEAGSTAQEEDVITGQINDFVNSVPAEPAAPGSADSPTIQDAVASPVSTETPSESAVAAPEAPTEEASQPTAEEIAATTADDQLMANAVDELAGGAPATDELASPNDSSAVTAPEPEVQDTPEIPAASEATPEEAKEEAEKTNIQISGKKVIKPLDSQPKPDINELLAREEAASGSADVATGPAIISSPATADQPEAQDETPAIVHQPGQSFAPQPQSEAPPTVTSDDQPSGGPAPAPSDKDDFDPNSVAL